VSARSRNLAVTVASRRGWSRPGWRGPLAVAAVLPFAVPFVWLLANAFKPVDQFYASPPALLPNPASLANISGVLALLDVPRLVANTTIIAGLTVLGTVLSSSLVGFAFAALPARGSGLLFAVLVATIMIPPSVLIVPQFILFSRLGWVDTYLPLVVPPLLGNAFFIFLFRQWFRALPTHLFECAELDGATPFQAYRHIALPLAGPAIAAVAVFAFVGAWNDFLGPLVYLRSPDSFTVSLGLATFQGIYANQLHHSVAMALVALVPPVVVFAVAQRSLVNGIATSGWRG
jgi:multiple sugar transport system permease protein